MSRSLISRVRKTLAPKRLLGRWISLWPEGAKAALARALADDKPFVRKHGLRLIATMAPECGIDALRAMGEYGPIMGASRDASVFPLYARSGRYAENTNAAFAEFFDTHGGGVYLDIGANIGLTTIPIARRASVSCFAFEPEPENFRNLATNVAANCVHDNVKLFQTAVFDRDASLKFELAPNNLGDHRVRMKESDLNLLDEDERPTITVRAAPLDTLVGEIRSPLAVKIDTQGAEPFVVAGGRRTLAGADLLVIEWSPYHMARMGGDPRVVLGLLRENFSTGRTGEGENGATSASRAIAELCGQLERSLVVDQNNPNRYLEVMVMKAQAPSAVV
jgi:FkbM family methyltransferase